VHRSDLTVLGLSLVGFLFPGRLALAQEVGGSQLRTKLPAPWRPAHIPQPESARHSTWLAPMASAIVPGSGQILLHQDRGVIYMIAEVFLLQRFLSLWNESKAEERRYRDIALKIARAPFGATTRDTVFEYFEQMGKYVESGAYDTDPGPALVPPTDEATYNGNIWALAKRTYFRTSATPPDTSLEFQTALAFYRSRAIGPNFRWSWRDATIEQDLFRQTISQGDETFRRATQQLGLLLANHFLSAVDAFVSQRIRHRNVRLEHRLWFDDPNRPDQWRLRIGISF
jgi:hypothetical protein